MDIATNNFMISISISEETTTYDGMADVLTDIAYKINRGYKSGYNPTWSLDGYEEIEDKEEEEIIIEEETV